MKSPTARSRAALAPKAADNSTPRSIGFLLGLAAAIVGLESPVAAFPLRPWHMLVLVACVVALHSFVRPNGVRTLGRMKVTALDAAFMVFIIAFVLVETYNGYALDYSPILNGVIEPVFWLLTYISARAAVFDIDSAVVALKAFVLPIFVTAPISFAQALQVSPVLDFTSSFVSAPGFDSAIEDGRLLRASGLVGGWTSFGAYVSGVLVAALAILVIARQRGTKAGFYPLAVIGLCVAALLTTLTFSTTLAVVVIVLGTMPLLGLRPRLIGTLALAGVIGATVFGNLIAERLGEQFDGRVGYVAWLPVWVPNTIAYRVYVWTTQTVPAISERIGTGWGSRVYDATFGRSGALDENRIVPQTLRWTSPESQWLATWMTGGLVNLVVLVVLLVAVFFVLWRGLHSSTARWLAVPVLWLFLANVAIGFTAISITNKGLPGVLWPMVGFVAALVAASRSPSGNGTPISPQY